MNCDSCKHWIAYKGSLTVGQCHRYPPTTTAWTLLGFALCTSDNWADTEYDDWCGEYEAREGNN